MLTSTTESKAPASQCKHPAPVAGANARPVRSALFNGWLTAFSLFVILSGRPLATVRSRRPLARWMRFWARTVLWSMRALLGISLEIRGREHLPRAGAYILAAKHQSECDGIIMLSFVPDLAFVAMREVGAYPFVGPLLKKLEMILVDTDRGARERETLMEGGAMAARAERPILIYPEGTLNAVGTRGRYRSGVFHLSERLGLPVIPVATNAGLCWNRRDRVKSSGRAVVSILPPLAVATDKDAFMTALEDTIEAETERLVALRQTELQPAGKAVFAAGGPRLRASYERGNPAPIGAVILVPFENP